MPEFDMSPCTRETLHNAGDRGNWKDLEQILRPFPCTSFGVTNAETQLFLGSARRMFDTSVCPNTKNGVVSTILFDDGEIPDFPHDTFQTLVSIGVNVDLPNGDRHRPSHICGVMANLRAAEIIFKCRPNMKARNKHGDTPLAVAESSYDVSQKEKCTERYFQSVQREYILLLSVSHLIQEDEDFPELQVLRPQVADFIVNVSHASLPRLQTNLLLSMTH